MPACPGVAGPCRPLVPWSILADHATIPTTPRGREAHATPTTPPNRLDLPDPGGRAPGPRLPTIRPPPAGLRGDVCRGHALGDRRLPRLRPDPAQGLDVAGGRHGDGLLAGDRAEPAVPRLLDRLDPQHDPRWPGPGLRLRVERPGLLRRGRRPGYPDRTGSPARPIRSWDVTPM